ncbi:C40 family peptidase [Nocardia sp. CDC160]|uniref:C40 family peptidase n=1 Tax=Nocardia sp. CDC160 TaxID=3112166 RepID=UPI002DBB85A8|nr:NlpC/P60 family protein [Nocardia sp. CDC160]MEC3913110.1 NlpC/P60 family protein [Nocardia sp. CDC160]
MRGLGPEQAARHGYSGGGAAMSGDLAVSALAEPIIELLASFGSGGAGAASGTLREASAGVDEIHAASRASVDRMYDSWRGRAGDAAMDAALRGQTTAAMASERGREMAEIVERVEGEVVAGREELVEILRSFTAEVDALGTAGVSAGGVAALVESAIDHIGRAVRVVERVRAELDGETAAMNELVSRTPAPAQVRPASVESGVPVESGAAVVPAAVSTPTEEGVRQVGTTIAAAGGTLANGAALLGTGLSPGGLRTTPASVTTPKTPDRDHDSTVTRPQDGGVRLTLPDGSTVEAPNQRAADAVRNALSQVGTPYVWGGEAPGVGMDCSGLTQWAYAQAGVSLPRLAQEQGYGHQRVGPGDLMPGDLAVWDGHVAMVIGNGELVEAGDPVQVGPIRTQNSGMRFLGFYRPTA